MNRRSTKKGRWLFVPEGASASEAEKVETQRLEDADFARCQINTYLLAESGHDPFQSGIDAWNEFTNLHPPEDQIVSEGGCWIMVRKPPQTEYTVTPLSFWFAEPWPMTVGRAKRVKIVTPRGDLGLFPSEYVIVRDPAKYLEFIGEGIDMRFFGNDPKLPADKLFYIRSRGISKRDAIIMLIGEVREHGIMWMQASRETCAAFGMGWPSEYMLSPEMITDEGKEAAKP